jgi:hypothetical protein
MGISILAWLSSRDPHIGPRFRHLEKRHPYWPETKSRSILAWDEVEVHIGPGNMGLVMEMIL